MDKSIKEGLISLVLGTIFGLAMWDDISDVIKLKKENKRLEEELKNLEAEDAKIKALKARLEKEAKEARLEDQKMLERFKRRADVLAKDISEET